MNRKNQHHLQFGSTKRASTCPVQKCVSPNIGGAAVDHQRLVVHKFFSDRSGTARHTWLARKRERPQSPSPGACRSPQAQEPSERSEANSMKTCRISFRVRNTRVMRRETIRPRTTLRSHSQALDFDVAKSHLGQENHHSDQEAEADAGTPCRLKVRTATQRPTELPRAQANGRNPTPPSTPPTFDLEHPVDKALQKVERRLVWTLIVHKTSRYVIRQTLRGALEPRGPTSGRPFLPGAVT